MQEKVFIKNSKGLKLASIIRYPGKDRQYPTIMILHGFTGYKEEAHFEELERILVKNGFAVIRFDASGSGNSGGSFEKDYSMSNFLKDIKSNIDSKLTKEKTRSTYRKRTRRPLQFRNQN